MSKREENLQIYDLARSVPQDALKTIGAGRLRGMSDINPMWRIMRMTEIFGICGIGWKYTIDKQWTETYGDEVKCFCNVSLYIRDPKTNEWSDAIPGCGGSAIVKVEKSGKYVDDEGYKMALTDALSIAMKAIGIAADIWYGAKATAPSGSKYEQTKFTPSQSVGTDKLTLALDDLAKCTTADQVKALWNKWVGKAPEICTKGGTFFGAVADKIKTLN